MRLTEDAKPPPGWELDDEERGLEMTDAEYEQQTRDAFDLAISRGVLSDDPQAPNHAGRYMFMGHAAGCPYYFKDRITRRGISMSSSQVDDPETT